MIKNPLPNTEHGTLDTLITAALAEDIGSGDITSQLLISEQAQAHMKFVTREEIIACGSFIPAAVYAQLDAGVKIEARIKEGRRAAIGEILAEARGSARALLAGERVALNLMQRACGVATLTARYVEKVKGTKAVILDTRKTMPGLRMLDKYAVHTGGGQNHRMGLYDAVLIKDNHIALGFRGQGSRVGELVAKAKEKLSFLIPDPQSLIPVIVECDTLAQVREALAATPDRILLDNMDVPALQEAVRLAAGRVPLEASGGVSLDTVRAIAETGIDYISVGKLTHSAPAADIGAEIAPIS